MNTEKWLNKLERKFGRYAVPGIMNILITGMVIVYIWDAIISPASGKFPLSPLISFSRDLILEGQVWRIVSFIFEPIATTPFFLIFTFYFYWLIGQVMENQWGVFRFNIFMLSGFIGSVIGGFITGGTSNSLIILSMFLAFAVIAPDFQIMLFFIIPVKIKYIAYLDAAFLLVSLIFSDFVGKIAILISLINLMIFFGEDFINLLKMRIHHWKYKIKNRK